MVPFSCQIWSSRGVVDVISKKAKQKETQTQPYVLTCPKQIARIREFVFVPGLSIIEFLKSG